MRRHVEEEADEVFSSSFRFAAHPVEKQLESVSSSSLKLSSRRDARVLSSSQLDVDKLTFSLDSCFAELLRDALSARRVSSHEVEELRLTMVYEDRKTGGSEGLERNSLAGKNAVRRKNDVTGVVGHAALPRTD